MGFNQARLLPTLVASGLNPSFKAVLCSMTPKALNGPNEGAKVAPLGSAGTKALPREAPVITENT